MACRASQYSFSSRRKEGGHPEERRKGGREGGRDEIRLVEQGKDEEKEQKNEKREEGKGGTYSLSTSSSGTSLSR